MKTVKEVSQMTGVSIRTLRYYDEIGLLKPTKLTESGYRLYDGSALEKLQEIMFFKELEIPLADIREMVENPKLSKKQVLAAQKAMLEKKCRRLEGIIELIADIMKGEDTMSFEEFQEGDVKAMIDMMQQGVPEEQFDEFIHKNGGSIEAYQEQLKQGLNSENTKASLLRWYGGKEKVMESFKPVSDMDNLRKEFDRLQKDFSAHKEGAGDEMEKEMVARLADLYKQMLCMDNARNFLLDLAKEYRQNEKLARTQDEQYGEGTAEYMAQAIQRYYGM